MGEATAPEGVDFSFPQYETEEDLKVMKNLLEIAEIRKQIAGLDLESAMLNAQTAILESHPYQYADDLKPLIAERLPKTQATQEPIDISASQQPEEPANLPEAVQSQKGIEAEESTV